MKVSRNLNGQAKLTYDNISMVKEQVLNGITYHWAVVMKSNWISDIRLYQQLDEQNKGICVYYPKDLLPKTVQRFIENHKRDHFATYDLKDGRVYEIYTYGF